jgi:uncharacterized membrane protein
MNRFKTTALAIGLPAALILILGCAGAGGSTDPITVQQTDEGAVSFSGTVLPILQDHCKRCHSDDRKGDLYVMDYAGVIKGGKSGAFVVPGQPDESRIVTSVEMTREPFMPPRIFPSLTEDRIAAIRAWIEQGANEN